MSFLQKTLLSNVFKRALVTQTSERSLNQVQLIGRVGQDPKSNASKEDPENKRVVLFSLATNEYLGAKDGEASSRTDWHRICIFKPRLQENVEKYVKQGDRVHVQYALDAYIFSCSGLILT